MPRRSGSGPRCDNGSSARFSACSERADRDIRIRELPHNRRDAALLLDRAQERALLGRGDVATDLALPGGHDRDRAPQVSLGHDMRRPAQHVARTDTPAGTQHAALTLATLAVRQRKAVTPDLLTEPASAERAGVHHQTAHERGFGHLTSKMRLRAGAIISTKSTQCQARASASFLGPFLSVFTAIIMISYQQLQPLKLQQKT